VPVDVVKGRHPLIVPERLAQDLQGAIGQHFVDVHVGAGARPALQGIHHHMLVELPIGHFRASTHDGFALGRIRGPSSQSLIRDRARAFHRTEAAHQSPMRAQV